jgi:hypothetical protein
LSVNYNIPTIDDRLQQVVDAIDAGSSNGVMRLLDTGGNILSSFVLTKPCATVSNGLLTFNGLSLIDPAAIQSGTATGARFESSSGTFVITGLTASTAGSTADILLSPTNIISSGQTVVLTGATITGH